MQFADLSTEAQNAIVDAVLGVERKDELPESVKDEIRQWASWELNLDGQICRFCNKPATCFGTYEGNTGYACDDCCGHGCEDGHCERLERWTDEAEETQ